MLGDHRHGQAHGRGAGQRGLAHAAFAGEKEEARGLVQKQHGGLRSQQQRLPAGAQQRLPRGEPRWITLALALPAWAQAQGYATPHYETTSVTGPDHSKVFEVSVLIRGEVWATGTGHSKQAAAKEAARLALEKIGQDIT